jgi:hypothetical protein
MLTHTIISQQLEPSAISFVVCSCPRHHLKCNNDLVPFRANVSTEDNEKLFSQRTLNAMARKQSGGQPSPQQQPAAKEHTK